MSILKTIYLQHLNGANANMTLDSSGRVGIGNTSPSFPLHVGGEIFSGRSDSSLEGGQISLGRASDDFAHYNIDCYGGSTTPSLRFIDNAAGAARMSIDSSGRVTRPYQPMFYARHNNNSSASGRYGLFDGVLTNQGGHASHSTFGGSYSYTRFTCPIAGKYFVWVGNIGPNTGTTQRTYVHKNGSNNSAQLRTGQTTNHGTSASMNVIIDAAANDWISCYSASDDGSMAFYSGEYSHMGVILIG